VLVRLKHSLAFLQQLLHGSGTTHR
jgi:hypothetical protein